MFNKLSFKELSDFYGTLELLEKHYGKQSVREAIEEMADRLDKQLKQPIGSPMTNQMSFDDVYIGQSIESDPLPFDDTFIGQEAEKKKRNVEHRNPNGQNEMKIRNFFGKPENNPDMLSTDEMILKLYYQDGMIQKEIGDMIGIKQRAISQYLNNIPEKRKRKIMAGWGINE